MANKITYLDYLSRRITITWFKAIPSDVDTYVDRVLADGGTIESLQCVRDAVADTSNDYEFECASTLEPLSYRWHGDDRYQPIRGSEITFNVLIQNDEEASLMVDLLGGGYYVNVTVDGQLQWIGKLFPEFYTEAYKQYPYTIAINASDQLGQLKDTQPLMIDYPEPWPTSNTQLLQFFNKILTDDGIKPSADYLTAPEELRTSIRIHGGAREVGKLLEEIHIDPLVFINEDDQYQTKYEIIEAILEPLHCFIMQWDGRWCIFSCDALWDAGNYNYRNYFLNYENGAYYQHEGSVNDGVLDLYELQSSNTNPVTRQLYNDAIMEYLPTWRQVTLDQTFVENTNLLGAFANLSGTFYYGSEGVQLEFNSSANRLNHWDYLDGGIITDQYPTSPNNGGWVAIPFVREGDPALNRISKSFTIPSLDYDTFFIEISSFTNQVYSDFIIDSYEGPWMNYEIKYEIDGSDWWYWDNDGQFGGWNDEFRIYKVPMGDISLDTGLPYKDVLQNGTLTISILFAQSEASPVDTSDRAQFSKLKVSLRADKWRALEYDRQSTFEIYNLATKLNITKSFKWGIVLPFEVNLHEEHISTPYDDQARPIIKYYKEGDNSEPKILTDWLLLSYFDDNSQVTPKITGKYRSRYINPFRLVYDYEDRVYGWQNAEYQSRSGVWSMTYTEYNAVRNLPEQPVKCDFSTFDFNNDFCTEIASGYLYDYLVRVNDDGGTVEAASCVQDAINNL